jgi:hypothetical protein
MGGVATQIGPSLPNDFQKISDCNFGHDKKRRSSFGTNRPIPGVKIILAVLTLLSVSAADARGHRRPHDNKPAAQPVQDDKSSSDKASAEIDNALNRSLKSICRGC